MKQLESVGFKPLSPEQELELALAAVNQLRKTLKKQRIAFKERRMIELDTEIANAWLISGEVEQRLETLKGVKEP